MHIRIFHTDDLSSAYFADGPGTGLREVFAYEHPDPDGVGAGTDHPDHQAVLGRVFMLFNVGDDPAFGAPDPIAVAYREHRLRSLSAGDVVALDDTFYACASGGWQQLDTAPEIVEAAEPTDAAPPCAGLTLRDPGELIAAIPILLGFRPTHGLVLIVYTGHNQPRALDSLLRVDLPEPPNIDDWVEQLRAAVANQGGTGVGLVVLGGDRPAADTTSSTLGHHKPAVPTNLPGRDSIARLASALTGTGMEIVDALWTAGVDSDTWHCYRDAARSGAIPDPAALPMVAALTVAGEVAYGSREDIAAVLAPDAAEVLDRRAALLADLPVVEPAREMRLLAEIVHRVHAAAEGEPSAGEPVLDDATITRLAHALVEDWVRDLALALCVGPRAAAAERVWTRLVRGAPRELVAHPAYLLGVCAYLRGQGTLARFALDLACQSDPHHPLAGSLRQALNLALPPVELRRALEAIVAQWVHGLKPAGIVRNGQSDGPTAPAERA